MGLVPVDVFAALMAVVGFHIAFRQDVVRRLWNRLRARSGDSGAGKLSPDPTSGVDPMRSVFRMAGVMIMAFSVVSAAFANLIAHYASAPPSV